MKTTSKYLKLMAIASGVSALCISAQAETLAGVGWAANQNAVVCYLFNSGPGAVNVVSKTIIPEISGSYTVAGNCGATLNAGQICAFHTTVPAGGANACQTVITPSAANVRGQMEVRNAQGVILNSIGLR